MKSVWTIIKEGCKENFVFRAWHPFSLFFLVEQTPSIWVKAIHSLSGSWLWSREKGEGAQEGCKASEGGIFGGLGC